MMNMMMTLTNNEEKAIQTASRATSAMNVETIGRGLREQDRFVPIANVGKVMRKILGPIPKISMESKECIQECVSEFISFLTSEAAEKCEKDGRKTLNGEDLLFSLERLGFDYYVEPMKTYLSRYRSMNTEQRNEGLNN